MRKFKCQDPCLIGVISDTHGHLPAAARKAFKKVSLIIHAGDIGDQKVIDDLSKIAPTVAVRGNMDFGKWADRLPKTEIIEIGQIVLYVLHNLHRLDVEPNEAGFRAVIVGHTHRPDAYENNGITFLNPGSASFPKFGNPAAVAFLHLKRDTLRAQLIELKD